jgi:hypothetical protein
VSLNIVSERVFVLAVLSFILLKSEPQKASEEIEIPCNNFFLPPVLLELNQESTVENLQVE